MLNPDNIHCSLFQYDADAGVPLRKQVVQRQSRAFTVASIAEAIRSGQKEEQVLHAREALKDKEEFRRRKGMLPGFTTSGVFKGNSAKGSLERHNLMVGLDYDGIEDVEALRQLVIQCPYTFMAFESVSGNGLKVFVVIEPQPTPSLFQWTAVHEAHAWPAIEAYYREITGRESDKACKNINRICYIPYDPRLYLNRDALPFPVDWLKQAKPITSTPSQPSPGTNGQAASQSAASADLAKISRLYIYLREQDKSITASYEEWTNVAFALADTFDYATGYEWFDKLSQQDACYEIDNVRRKWEEIWKANNRNTHGPRRTFASIVDAGKRQGWKPARINENGNAYASFVEQCLRDDEVGDARLLAQLNKDTRLFETDSLGWMIYNNGVWKPDHKRTVELAGLQNLRNRYKNEADKLVGKLQALKEDENDKQERYEKLKEAYKQRIRSLNKRTRMRNVLELSKAYMAAHISEFDQQGHLINLSNGVYDLREHAFYEHSEKLRFMKQAGTHFDEHATCPRWIEFLSRIFLEDKQMIEFIQEWVGLCLTGEQGDFQAFVYCYGNGANGKSMFFDVLRKLLGDYFVQVPVDLLLAKTRVSESDSYLKTRLQGARLVLASEIPQGERLNESQIKDMTGGELITARHPYGRPFTFPPTHKLAIFGNHKFNLRGTDEGIWRRVWLTPFLYHFAENERRPPREVQAEFDEELSGILRWAIEGLQRFQERNAFVKPQLVKDATDSYREESDVLAPFLAAHTRRERHASALLKDVWERYISFCENEEKSKPVFSNNRQFLKALVERGYEKGQDPQKRGATIQDLHLIDWSVESRRINQEKWQEQERLKQIEQQQQAFDEEFGNPPI